jgi:membrane-associated phospholipid phosphatase
MEKSSNDLQFIGLPRLLNISYSRQMKPLGKICFLISLSLPLNLFAFEDSKGSRIADVRSTILMDFHHFYTPGNLRYLLGGVCLAGVLANTNADRETQNWIQRSVRNNNTDQFSKVVKPIGNIYEPISIYAGLSLLGSLTRKTSFGAIAFKLGSKSLRTIVVGAPVVGTLQYVLGASRPTENGPEWHPFHDTNAVSGHAFLGAVPFLTVSQMVRSKYLKMFFYVGSFTTGFSRINDNKHYFSQVALGWWIAYLSSISVNRSKRRKVDFQPSHSREGWKIRLFLSL